MNATERRFRSAMDLGGLSLREALGRTWAKMNEHELMTRAAAITFYALASLVPFLALLVLIAAHLLPWIARGQDLDPMTMLRSVLPADAASLLGGQLEDVRGRGNAGLASAGTLAVLWLNSSLFMAVMDAANVIAGVTETRPYWKRRLMGVMMAVLVAVLLILALASTLLWPQILGLMKLGALSEVALTAAQALSVLGVVLVSFALAMYFAPDARQRWEWITPGSLLGSLLLVGVSQAFRFYVQRWGDYSATYGSLAGVVVLTSWMWICAVELLAAAEFNKVIEDASPFGKDYGQRREDAATRARAEGFFRSFFRRGPIQAPPNRMRPPLLPEAPDEEGAPDDSGP